MKHSYFVSYDWTEKRGRGIAWHVAHCDEPIDSAQKIVALENSIKEVSKSKDVCVRSFQLISKEAPEPQPFTPNSFELDQELYDQALRWTEERYLRVERKLANTNPHGAILIFWEELRHACSKRKATTPWNCIHGEALSGLCNACSDKVGYPNRIIDCSEEDRPSD